MKRPGRSRSGWRRGALVALRAAAALALGLVAWGVGIEPRLLEVEREVAIVPGLPEVWSGAWIAVIGDFQVGMWLDNEGTIGDAVRRIVEDGADAVVLLGDFIYAQEGEPGAKVAVLSELLRPLVDSRIPTFAVLGNHDYGQDSPDQPPIPSRAALVREGLEKLGIDVLENEAISLVGSSGGPPLYLVGIGPRWPGIAAPAVALAKVPDGAPRFVFMHNPQSFLEIAPGGAPVAVAAHTHGGQVRVPFLPGWSWLTLVKGSEAIDGWIASEYGAPGNRLYVNRGIGFSTLPVRINCRPELTVFTLRGAAAEPPPRR